MSKQKKDVSPLVVGLLHVLPSWILIGVIAVVVANLYLQKNQNVLGVETTYTGLVETTTREERINQLENELKKSDSGVIKERLEILNK